MSFYPNRVKWVDILKLACVSALLWPDAKDSLILPLYHSLLLWRRSFLKGLLPATSTGYNSPGHEAGINTTSIMFALRAFRCALYTSVGAFWRCDLSQCSWICTDISDFVLQIKLRNSVILEPRIRQIRTSPSGPDDQIRQLNTSSSFGDLQYV